MCFYCELNPFTSLLLTTNLFRPPLQHWFQIIRTQTFQMYDDVQPRVPYLSSSRSHCPHPFPTNQISTPIAIFYGGNDTLVDIKGLLSDLPELVGVWEVPNYEHLGKGRDPRSGDCGCCCSLACSNAVTLGTYLFVSVRLPVG